MSLQPFELEVGGTRVAGLRNSGDGPRVLALHGWLDNAASFVPLAPHLASLQLVAIDLPGHGHSAHLPAGASYTTAAAICHVLDVADALGWDRFSLLGHSMGAGIATSCLSSGLQVTLVDSQSRALEAGQQRIADALEGAVRRGKLAAEAAAAARTRLTTADAFRSLGAADVVIEAVYENLALKEDIFRALDASCRAGALLATNTSTLDVAAIASATARPQDVIGMHFFSPAHIMRLVEIVRAPQTSPASVARAVANLLARRDDRRHCALCRRRRRRQPCWNRRIPHSPQSFPLAARIQRRAA